MKIQVLFENYYQNSLIHKSKGTCEYEKAKINRLLRLFKDISISNTDQIDKNVLNRLILRLREEVSNKTINKLILILKLAYRYNDIDFDYLNNLKKLKEDKKRFEIIKQNELKKVVNYVYKLDPNEGNNSMYQCMLFLMLETGVRVNELVNIEKKNIDIQNKAILLTTTKTKKHRYVYYTKLSEVYIKHLFNQKNDSNYLFFNRLKSRKANQRDVRYIVDKIKLEVNISSLHPHMFRHTFATLAYENGMDIFVLKELLGHENIETTMIYTHLSIKKIKESYQTHFKINLHEQ